MTGFDSKILRDEPDSYRISFYTDSREAYELVQDACRLCVDAKNTAQAAPTAHWVLKSTTNLNTYKCSNCGEAVTVVPGEDVYDIYPRCECRCCMRKVGYNGRRPL